MRLEWLSLGKQSREREREREGERERGGGREGGGGKRVLHSRSQCTLFFFSDIKAQNFGKHLYIHCPGPLIRFP